MTAEGEEIDAGQSAFSLLWQEGPGAIKASPSSVLNEDPVKHQADVWSFRVWVVTMVLAGGGGDFAAGVCKTVSRNLGNMDDVTVFFLSFLSFFAAALPPTLTKADRISFSDMNTLNPNFKYKVLIPGLADLVITGMKYSAILYISPAIMSMLKTASQLVVLTILQSFRGKPITKQGAMCLGGCMAGLIFIYLEEATTGGEDDSANEVFGLTLAVVSGAFGAVRNLVEEIILQGDDLSPGGLLMAESWVSFIGVFVTTFVYELQQGKLWDFLLDTYAGLSFPVLWIWLFMVMFCTWGKEYGKLFIVKHGSAMIAKVLTMLLPVVTWIMGLSIYSFSDGKFGEYLTWPGSLLRFIGFSIIAGSAVAFMQLKKK